MNFNTYTQKSLEAVQSARQLAVQSGHQQLEQVHLLLALLQQDGGLIPQLLRKMDITVESLEAAANAENLQFKGLMTMAPLTDDRGEWLQAFQKLAAARDKLEKSLNITLPELSMGMSGDFHEAVQCGSTLIRIGTRLFGNRQYKTSE